MHPVFERDFDHEAALERERGERALCARHTPEELEAAVSKAEADAYTKGWEDGHNSGTINTNATLLARQTEALDALSPQIGELIGAGDRHRGALEGQAVGFVLAVFEQVFPEFRSQRALDRVAEQVRHAVGLALGSASLRIFLSEAAAPGLAPMLESAARAQGFEARIEIGADAGLADGDVRVEWDNGFMEYSFDALCAQILDALRRSKAALAETK